jgi:predicted Zn-dependent peptidase
MPALLRGAIALAALVSLSCDRPSPIAVSKLRVDSDYYTLANGLKVVLSRDTTAPKVGVGVYYHVGFRREPKGRTGFSHLFEHLMFQGSGNLGKLQFIKLVESSGGFLNGGTRYDFTSYYEVVPSNALERILWGEADRMKGLAIDQSNVKNQQDVVKNEVRVNVLNQPYGSFPWIDLPIAANENWHNAHNFYGDMKDLDAATVPEASAFFKSYYAPNNAVLCVVGDFEPAQARQWIGKYFAAIPKADQIPVDDIAEPPQTREKRAGRTDALANRPAIALGYHMPERWTPDWYAMGLIDQILGQGRDSKLYEALVQRASLTSDVAAGVNVGLGTMFDYEGPMLWVVSVFHDRDKTPDILLRVIDAEIDSLATVPLDSATLARAKTKMRSALYGDVEDESGLGRLDMLASFALFDNDPTKINQLDDGFAAITTAQIQKTAQAFLKRENRTVYTIVPGARDAPGSGPTVNR